MDTPPLSKVHSLFFIFSWSSTSKHHGWEGERQGKTRLVSSEQSWMSCLGHSQGWLADRAKI